MKDMHDEPDPQPGAAIAAPPAVVPAPEPPPRRRPARASGRAGWLLALLPLAFALALPLLLLGREVAAPSWLRGRVEAAAAAALDGGRINVERMTLRVGRDLHPVARLTGVTFSDPSGRVLAQIPELRATLSPRGLVLRRAVLVQAVTVVGPELALARREDGRLDLALPAGEGLGLAGLAALPGAFERLWERPALAALRRVRVEGLVVNYEDRRAGRAWTLDGGELSLDLEGGNTRIVGEVSVLSGGDGVARARLDYRGARGSPRAELALTMTDVPAADVASQAPALAWLGVVDAPISVALRGSLDGAGALGPVSVGLKMARGELRPSRGAPGVPFELARAFLAYDPASGAVRFDRLEVRSAWGSVRAGGQAWLGDMEDGLPRSITGQFEATDLRLAPPGFDPVALPGGSAQLRLRLRPFGIEVAAAGVDLPGGAGRLEVAGTVGASPEGWAAALDAWAPPVGRDAALALWPEAVRPGLRAWAEANLSGGALTGLSGSLRIAPGIPPAFAVTGGFEGMAVRALPGHPPIEDAAGRIAWDGRGAVLALERGSVAAPEGGAVDLAGTALLIPPGGGARVRASLDLRAAGTVTAALSLLDLAPLGVMAASGLPPSFAEGQAAATGTVGFFLGPMTPDEVGYDVRATLRDVSTDALVPGRVVAADELSVAATPAGVEVAGQARVGGTGVDGAWRLSLPAGTSALEATVPVTAAVLADWGVALPPGTVAGEGSGRLTIEFEGRPRFAFRSDLAGVALALPALGWSKGRGDGGALAVEGTLAPLAFDRVALDAGGLSAEGDLRLTADGGFDSLALDRLEVGGWLDAGVTLRARPGSSLPAVEVAGGTLDLSRMPGGGGEASDGGGPLSVALDRLVISDGIALAPFRGEFDASSGLEGTFTGLLGGEVPVAGRVAPQDGRVGARVQGDDAGAALRAAGLFDGAAGGVLDVLLLPEGEASYRGELYVTGLKVVEAPVLASLLNAASVVGLLQQLGGAGILFDEVSAEFRIDPGRVIVGRSSAVGAGLGLSMDGVFDTDTGAVDLRGVLSPFFLVNGIGSVLTRPGEGLLGFNWTLRGTTSAPVVGVNPLSVLAPGAIRDALRRPG